MKDTIDKFKGISNHIKSKLLTEQNQYKTGKMQGMIDAYEHCADHLNQNYPHWTVWTKDIIFIFIGAIIGIVLVLTYQLN